MELDPVDRVTAGAVGQPGERTFFIQAKKNDELVTVLVEKQQVQLLSASILEILARIGEETGPGPEEEEMELESPLEPIWRAGRLSIGYREDKDMVLLEIEEALPEEESDEREGDRLRLWASREQMLSLSRHGALVCQRGRPPCQYCGNPLDPKGHACPAMNGHKNSS